MFRYLVFFHVVSLRGIEALRPREEFFETREYSRVGYSRSAPVTLYMELCTYDVGRRAWGCSRGEWEYPDEYIRLLSKAQARRRILDAVILAQLDW